MSKSQLDRIERGEVALDRLSQIVALANALQIAPGYLMRLPVPAPANGHTDSATDEVRLALLAVSRHRPGGQRWSRLRCCGPGCMQYKPRCMSAIRLSWPRRCPR